jgi:hypothetical protein
MLGRTLFIVAVLSLIAACSSRNEAQTHQVDDYFITVSSDPETFQVGRDAEITIHIEKDNESVAGCKPRFRQYMPARQMVSDHTFHNLEPLEPGLYRGRGTEFSVGGDWELEFQFNCGDGMKTIVFPYTLQWM